MAYAPLLQVLSTAPHDGVPAGPRSKT